MLFRCNPLWPELGCLTDSYRLWEQDFSPSSITLLKKALSHHFNTASFNVTDSSSQAGSSSSQSTKVEEPDSTQPRLLFLPQRVPESSTKFEVESFSSGLGKLRDKVPHFLQCLFFCELFAQWVGSWRSRRFRSDNKQYHLFCTSKRKCKIWKPYLFCRAFRSSTWTKSFSFSTWSDVLIFESISSTTFSLLFLQHFLRNISAKKQNISLTSRKFRSKFSKSGAYFKMRCDSGSICLRFHLKIISRSLFRV